LCGAFNTNLIREAIKYLAKHGTQNVDLFVVGRKGRDFFRRLGKTIDKEYLNIFNALNFAHAELITQDLLQAYSLAPSLPRSPYVSVDMLYNEFKSVIQQRLMVRTYYTYADRTCRDLSVSGFYLRTGEGTASGSGHSTVFEITGVSGSARVERRRARRADASMDSATRNASELLSSLTLTMNRTRQSSITKEILEVVSGAEALK